MPGLVKHRKTYVLLALQRYTKILIRYAYERKFRNWLKLSFVLV